MALWGNPLKMTFSLMYIIYSPGPLTIRLGCPTYRAVKLRWSFGVLVYVILVGQFPIGQSKQTKSELTRNIIKVDKEPENQPKRSRG